jgi:hypothetical protein
MITRLILKFLARTVSFQTIVVSSCLAISPGSWSPCPDLPRLFTPVLDSTRLQSAFLLWTQCVTFAAPGMQYYLNRISSNERKKQRQLSGKGHNELLAIAQPLVQTRVATNACQSHASENRDTCCSTWFWLLCESLQRRASLQQIRHKNQHSHNLHITGLQCVVTCLWANVVFCPWFYLREATEFSGRSVARPLFPRNRGRAKNQWPQRL